MPAEKPDRRACIDGRGTFLQEIPHVLGRFTPAALAGSFNPSAGPGCTTCTRAPASSSSTAWPGQSAAFGQQNFMWVSSLSTSPASNKTEAAHDSIGGFKAGQRGVNIAI